MAGFHVCHLTTRDGKRKRGEPSSGPPRLEKLFPAVPFSPPDFQALVRVESTPLASEPTLLPSAR
jgi:hypothetical protein